MAAARHTPVAMAGGVAALLAAQLALLLASWLPWKMLALLGGGLPLPGWPAAWSLHQTAAALALATVAAYAAYLGADALVGRHARQGAARLVATTAKTGLFNQQDRLAQLLYTHLMRATGAAVFVALAVAVLAWQMPLLAVLSLVWIAAGICAVTQAGGWTPAQAGPPSRRPQLAAQAFVVGGFLLACGILITTHSPDAPGQILHLLLLLMLYRQVLAQAAALATHVRALQRRRGETLALFVASAPWRAPAPAASPFHRLWTVEAHVAVVRTLFARHHGRQPARLAPRLRKTARGHIAEWTLIDQDDPASSLFVRVFDHARDALAMQENDLLAAEADRLPACAWLGSRPLDGFACHYFRWSTEWTPVPDEQRRVAARWLRTRLLHHAPARATQERYLRSRTCLLDRLQPEVLSAMRQDILEPEPSRALDTLILAWPVIRAQLAACPLRLVLPQLGARPMAQDAEGQLWLMDWTRWRLEPAGAGWPVSARLREELQVALADAEGLELDLVELSALLHEFDQRIEVQDTSGAHALLPRIADIAQVLRLRAGPASQPPAA